MNRLGHAGRPEPRLAGHDEGRARRQRGADHLLALLGARDLQRAPQRSRRGAAAAAEERRRGDGDLRARLHLAGRCRLEHGGDRAAAEAAGRSSPATPPRSRPGSSAGGPSTRCRAPRSRRWPITSITSARSPASTTSASAATSTASRRVVEGLEDVSNYPDLTAELLKRGYTDEDVKKVLGLNVLRAWRGAEQVAARLQKTRGPSTRHHRGARQVSRRTAILARIAIVASTAAIELGMGRVPLCKCGYVKAWHGVVMSSENFAAPERLVHALTRHSRDRVLRAVLAGRAAPADWARAS